MHGIGRADRELESGEDQTWVSVDQFERMLDAVTDRSDVRITFDDGNASDVKVALPRLMERGITAEFDRTRGMLGERGRVDHCGVRARSDAGMSIGSHGWAHRDWRQIDDAQAREELDDARRLLGELTGRPVSRVAIPFGSYTVACRGGCGRLRRLCVFTSDGGSARPDAWLQPRTSLRHDLDAAWITRVLEPNPSLIRRSGAAPRGRSNA